MRLLAALSLIAIAVFAGYCLVVKPKDQATLSVSAVIPTQPVAITKQEYRGLPMTLKIPAIGVDTAIEYTGLSANGDMAASNKPGNAAWYKYGAIPGEMGSAVIAGHVRGLKGEPAVFAHLNKLKKGDFLLVVDAKGQTASFTVREIRTYNQEEQHSEVFNSTAGTHLNIITCAGEWDSAQRRYIDRLVVFADLM